MILICCSLTKCGERMTYEEAIKELEQIPKHIGADCDGYEKRAIRIAIEALEKQIPKKPKRVDHWTLCSTCYDKYGFSYDILVGMRGLKTGECHCLNCGQAIDWSDT